VAYRTIGNTVVEWDDGTPLIFTLRNEVGPRDGREIKTVPVDLTDLRLGFTEDFLLNLKEHLMERCKRVRLISINTEVVIVKSLLAKTITLKLFETRISVIDEGFLLCLAAENENFPAGYLQVLRAAFSTNPHSALFAMGLEPGDFPTHKYKKGPHGRQIDQILAKALNRSAAAHILDVCDIAYAKGGMDIGHYSFVHLAFAVFVRPNSYRQIRIGDLTFDKESNQYWLRIVTSKTGEAFPSKVNYCLNEPLGVLLTKQRQHVISAYGHLVASEDIEQLALFPARHLTAGNSRWRTDYANENFGMFEGGDAFASSYPQQVRKKHFDDSRLTLNANALRHTVGTLLGQTGASANTIAAVLKHASTGVCKAYVDIAFHGMIEELSEAMHPAFAEHLPGLMNFRSKNDPVALEKLIRSDDLETGQVEDTGECGGSIACMDAPLVCYGCFRFIPYWDADHGINLRKSQQDMDDHSKRGKPFEHLVEKARTAKNQIILIMNAADRYRDAMQRGAQT
jgi:integrase